MELDLYKLELKEESKKAIDHYAYELSKISTGRANPQLIKGIRVDYYGTLTPLEELANIAVPEAQQLLIKPFDASSTQDITKAIMNANIGISPVNEGHQVRLTFPALTTQRRKELAKSLSKYAENAKVAIRNSRQNVNKMIKADEELSEDAEKMYLEEIQKIVDSKIAHIDEMTSKKEAELMKI